MPWGTRERDPVSSPERRLRHHACCGGARGSPGFREINPGPAPPDDIPELGVVLLGPRAYDPDLGRFLQRDPISITSRSTTANPYAFGFSDPVNFSDSTGLNPLLDIWNHFTGGASSNSGAGGFSGGDILVGNVLYNAVNLLQRHNPFDRVSGGDVVRNAFSSARTACGWRCSVRDAGLSAAKFAWDNDIIHNPKAQGEFVEGFATTAWDGVSSSVDKLEKCAGGLACLLVNEVKGAGSALANAPDLLAAVATNPGSVYDAACPGGRCGKP